MRLDGLFYSPVAVPGFHPIQMKLSPKQ